MRIKVLKRSGKTQPFMRRKVERTVKAAGAGAALAKAVAKCVYQDLSEDMEHFSEQLVPSVLIRNKVLRYLTLSSPRVAGRYRRKDIARHRKG